MDYSERIKSLRKNRHLSQDELAKLLNVTKQTISQYERGIRKPDVLTIEALCDIFNVSSDYLLGLADVTVRLVGQSDLMKLDTSQYDEDFRKLYACFESLNPTGQQEALNRLQEMASLSKFTEKR